MSGTSVTRRRLAGCGALLGLLALAACSSGKPAAAPDPYQIGPLPQATTVAQDKLDGQWHRDDDHTLTFTGLITPAAATAFEHLVTPKTTTVKVSSPGGDPLAALSMAGYLTDHHLAIDVVGPCAGPCADYWFPAAATRSVEKGGWLGLTPDVTTIAATDPGALHGTAAQVSAAEKEQDAIYRAAGVNAALLRSELSTELQEQPGTENSASPAQLWMPSVGDLSKLGYRDLTTVWLPPNLASANANAQAWGVIAAYDDTLVGFPPPKPSAPATGKSGAPRSAPATATTAAAPGERAAG
jgi:hypothetical protein